jgi:RNA-directed DNA polymerase
LDGPRGRSFATPRPARLSLKTAIQHGVSSKSYWHMARTPALQQALSNAWLKAQGLVSVKDLWCKAQGYTT